MGAQPTLQALPQGELYDISQDRLEKTPLVELSPVAQQARTTLQEVLDQYKEARPPKDTPRKKRKAETK